MAMLALPYGVSSEGMGPCTCGSATPGGAWVDYGGAGGPGGQSAEVPAAEAGDRCAWETGESGALNRQICLSRWQ
jgi:hypothetical protein